MKKLIPALAVVAAFTAAPAFAVSHSIAGMIEEYDTNKDGQVTRAEFEAYRHVRFDETDADKSGELSEAEYVAEFEARLNEDLKTFDRDEEKKVEEYQRQMRQVHVRFGVLDTNKNGSMTFAEFLASGIGMFERQDRDKNGVIDETDRTLLKAEQDAGKGDDFIAP
ncbi:hypothetical protein ABAC460_06825 [Asticcacaulis sp. AC460]|uniref:hypothetical protein n=1 Tax=Asticcacaulis sp. AC460 TaxID=1282360 RepID=UPI0003C3B2DD|nr:hypothetical protein [Asticcacaulis sp. AC460]ESQ91273.1 hypothetical protein ABAC460_06825 [Asticcacaulis sp. AC460]